MSAIGKNLAKRSAKRSIWAAAAMLAGVAGYGVAQASEDPAFGLWLTETGSAIVKIDACGESACGEIVWLETPLGDDGAPMKDTLNPDPEKQTATLCGSVMLGDFEKKADGEWESGYIYDAASGDTYSSLMEIQDDGSLEVRGYVGVSFLGRSQTWSRVEDDRGGC